MDKEYANEKLISETQVKLSEACKAYYDMVECSLITKLPEAFKELRSAKEKIMSVRNAGTYDIALEQYLSDFHAIKTDKEERKKHNDMVKFLQDPLSFDIEQLQFAKAKELVYQYKPYWEGAISRLKRPSAIVNRRKYLIEQINLILPTISKYPDLGNEMREYLQFNISQIDASE